MTQNPPIDIKAFIEGPDHLRIQFMGRLDSETTGGAWSRAVAFFEKKPSRAVTVDASGILYCDVSGVGLLLELQRRQRQAGGAFRILGLREEFKGLLDLFDPEDLKKLDTGGAKRIPLIEEIGKSAYDIWVYARGLIAFVGEVSAALAGALMQPLTVRWKDAFLVAETAGVNALPIIGLISLLIGLIMAFQSAIPMRQFGAEIYVANLVGLSMIRELGPLMTAIVLAGRSGSAFAAEIGTMKVNEEIDALRTMGLEPVRFLVTSRILAAVAVTPLLTIYSDFVGVAGGSIVLVSLGYPVVTYFNQVLSAVNYVDFLGGLAKSLVFGLMVAGIGCFQGLATRRDARAVGESTTSAVVGGIILIVLAYGAFSVVFYALGI